MGANLFQSGAAASGSSAAPQKYSQSFPANAWGGKAHTFTVPAGVSRLKATAVAAGGCVGGTSTMNGIGGNSSMIFARTNGIDPFFLVTGASSSSLMALNIMGTQISGSVENSSTDGVNGSGDASVPGRMHGGYFNAADSIPWGISVSQSGSAATTLVISSTTDGFNFSHVSTGAGLTASPNAGYYINSVVFGGAGEAMVVPTGSFFYYTKDYGNTWSTIATSTAIGGASANRARYFGGTWVILTAGSVFYYTTTPTAGAWSAKNTTLGSVHDMGWTGSTYVAALNDVISCGICSTLGGTWAYQAHGGDKAFTGAESGNGEVLLYAVSATCASPASMRGTSGAATAWFSACPHTLITNYDAVKHIPFAGGGMWVIGATSGTTAWTRASVVSGSASPVTVLNPIPGNSFSNGTYIKNILWCGGNFCYLGNPNGLGKYASPGVITASLISGAQLTAEFGFNPSNIRSSALTITRFGTTLLSLQGGGTSGTNAGAGGGNSYPSPGTGRGSGPGGSGGLSASTAGISQIPSGNGGWGALTGNLANGGGGVPNQWGGLGNAPPLPNTKVPGASGGGGQYSTGPGCGGGGGSLFSPAGNGYVPSSYTNPTTVFSAAARVGSYGAGAHGIWAASTTCFSGAGGGEGCYRYEISVTPGDVLTINVPGVAYVYTFPSGASGIPGGEGYCLLEWEV